MSTGQAVGGVVGAVAGYFVGNPVMGAQIGMTIGGMLDPPKGPTTEGPRLNDLTVQTSTYGASIARTDGTIGVSGNVFWLENNKLKEVVKKENSGGKGGGSSSTVKTYTYFATFAVGLCEGPIAGVRRIWVGPDLIYNAGSDDLESIIASNQAAKGFSVYTGTEDQQPDPRMQAEMGVANCPAYRGLAYIVLKDLALAKYGNSVAGAQVKVEVANIPGAIVLPIDETPAISDTFNWLRVFGDIGDLYGVRLMDQSTVRGFGGANASFVYRDFRLGNLGAPSSATLIPDINISEFPSTVRSSDSRRWYQYRGNDPFILNEPYLRTDDALFGGSFIKMGGTDNYAQDIIDIYQTDISPTTSQHGIIFTFNALLTRERLDHIAHAPVITGTGLAYNIANTLSEESGWNVCTAGDVPFQWRITGASDSSPKDFYIKTYDSTLSGVITAFSGALPATWPRMTSGSHQEQKVVCRISNGTVYLIGKDRTDDSKYRVAIITASGTQDEYEFTSPNAVGEDMCTVWPYDENQGIALTSNRVIQWRRYSDGLVQLSEIIESECALSGLLTGPDVDASALTDSVIGFKVSSIGSIRNAIEPLRGAWPFDVVQSGYQIKVTPRGRTSIATIPHGDLLMDSDLEESREMDAQLPAVVQIKYLDQGRDYDANEQRAARNGDETVNTLSLDLPVVLTADQAAQVSEKLLYIYWLERSDFSFKLPPSYRYLEPADVVTVVTEYASYEFRLSTVNYESDGSVGCTAKANNAAVYTSIAEGGSGITAPGTVPLAGSTYAAALDIPVVDETLQNAPGFVVAMTGDTEGWPGGILYRTEDGGQTWADLQAFAGKCVFGSAMAPLSGNACNLIQKGGSLKVELISGALESVTESQMLNGSNVCAYGADGRWEILRFQNAALNADGTYTISTFWRGDKGTEWATGLHASGDTFVLLTDPDNAFVGVSLDSIGAAKTYRAVTAGADIGSASDQPFTYVGVNLECLSPVHAKGVRDGSSNLSVAWQRRTRIGGAWRDYVDATLGEAVEAYEIDVMNGATVVRTITSATQSATYSAANQTTDFGSPQSSITLRIYQMSDKVGRGYPLEKTL